MAQHAGSRFVSIAALFLLAIFSQSSQKQMPAHNARDIIVKYFAAVGGKEKLEALGDLVIGDYYGNVVLERGDGFSLLKFGDGLDSAEYLGERQMGAQRERVISFPYEGTDFEVHILSESFLVDRIVFPFGSLLQGTREDIHTDTVVSAAIETGLTFAQSSIRWALEDKKVSSVLISMRTFEHVDEYLKVSGTGLG